MIAIEEEYDELFKGKRKKIRSKSKSRKRSRSRRRSRAKTRSSSSKRKGFLRIGKGKKRSTTSRKSSSRKRKGFLGIGTGKRKSRRVSARRPSTRKTTLKRPILHKPVLGRPEDQPIKASIRKVTRTRPPIKRPKPISFGRPKTQRNTKVIVSPPRKKIYVRPVHTRKPAVVRKELPRLGIVPVQMQPPVRKTSKRPPVKKPVRQTRPISQPKPAQNPNVEKQIVDPSIANQNNHQVQEVPQNSLQKPNKDQPKENQTNWMLVGFIGLGIIVGGIVAVKNLSTKPL